MLVGSVSRIDDGDIGHFRGITGSPLQVVTHDDQIDIVADHQDRILQCLAFRRTGGTGILKSDHTAAQAVHGCLEAQTRTGRGLEKQGGCNFTFKYLSVWILFKLPGIIQNTKNVLFGALID